MNIGNRLPRDFLSAGTSAERRSAFDSALGMEIMADTHARDAVAALLHLLTQLANCGMDAGAPPLLQSAQSEG